MCHFFYSHHIIHQFEQQSKKQICIVEYRYSALGLVIIKKILLKVESMSVGRHLIYLYFASFLSSDKKTGECLNNAVDKGLRMMTFLCLFIYWILGTITYDP